MKKQSQQQTQTLHGTKNATSRAAIKGKSVADGIAIRIEEENGFTSNATSCANDTTNDVNN